MLGDVVLSNRRSCMSLVVRVSALLALAVLALGTAATAVASTPRVHAAKSCSLSSYEQRHLGASYVTQLSVKGTSCASGKSLVRAFNACRHSSGGARGHCNRRVNGYRCSESRSGIKVQYDSRTACVNGSRKVNFRYTQNT
jgi:hypothetical protein